MNLCRRRLSFLTKRTLKVQLEVKKRTALLKRFRHQKERFKMLNLKMA